MKQPKRIFTLLTAVILLLSILVVSVGVAASRIFPTSGKCGDQITWTIHVLEGTDTRILTISGTGRMYDMDSSEIGWVDAYDTVIIEEGITYVGQSNFFPGGGGNSGMTVSLPSTLEAIGSGAFGMTHALKEITIPPKVTVLPTSVFSNSGLRTITIQGTITEIGYAAFSVNNHLESFPFKEGLLSIGVEAFNSCFALTDVNLPASLQSIGQDAFRFCTAKVTVNNPNCVIADSEGTLGTPGTTVIQGYTGSTAEAYAQKYGYTFLAMTPGCQQGVHSYGAPVKEEATCTTPARSIYTCTLCGCVSQEETGPALGHDYLDETVPATTTEQGYTLHTCQRCGHSYKDSFTSTHSHSYTDSIAEPTCTEGGYTVHTCGCGDSYRDNETEALGHSWEDPSAEERVCLRCDTRETTEQTGYQVIEGGDSRWDPSGKEDHAFRLNMNSELFLELEVDGQVLEPSCYTAEEASSVITLAADYLETLTPQTHTIVFRYQDGEAVTTLMVEAAETGDPTDPTQAPPASDPPDPSGTQPKSNPATVVLWILILIFLLVAIGVAVYFLIIPKLKEKD